MKLDPHAHLMAKKNTSVSENSDTENPFENSVNFAKSAVLIPDTNPPGEANGDLENGGIQIGAISHALLTRVLMGGFTQF